MQYLDLDHNQQSTSKQTDQNRAISKTTGKEREKRSFGRSKLPLT